MKIKSETDSTLTVSTGSPIVFVIPFLFVIIGIILIPQLHIVPNIPIYWSFIFGGLGIVSLLFGKVSTLTFDKSNHTMTVKSTGIFGSQVKTEKLEDVQSINVIESYGSQSTAGGGSMPRMNYQVILKRTDGSIIPLGSSSKGVGFSFGGIPLGSVSKPAIVATAQHIAQFLNVSFNDKEPLSLGNAVGAIENFVTRHVENQK